MCGRFTRTQSWAEVLAFSELPIEVRDPAPPPSWNVCPSQRIPVVVHGGAGQLAGIGACWGLKPAWATRATTAPINARADSVAVKPFFRDAFRKRRCLVPADGWYEWTATPGGKQPHYIVRSDGDPLFFAGLWEAPAQPDAPPTVAIVTTEAAAELRDLHGRQPVVLAPGDWQDWLTLPGEARQALEAMLQPLPEGTFRHFPVSRRVNTPREDDASLIQPA